MNNKMFMTARVKEFNADDRTIIATVSSGKVDRDREIVRARGWDLKTYMTHPIILTNHNANDVLRSTIGTAQWVKVIKGELVMKIYLGKTGAGQEAFDMIADLGVAAFSCGFRGLEFKQMTVSELEGEELLSAKAVGLKGTDVITVITKAELYEVSLVSLPADQYALMKGQYEPTAMVKAGFDNLIRTKNLQETYKDIDFKEYMPQKEEKNTDLDNNSNTITITTEQLQQMIDERVQASFPKEPMVEIHLDVDEPMVEVDLSELDKTINNILNRKYNNVIDNTINDVKRKINRMLGKVLE